MYDIQYENSDKLYINAVVTGQDNKQVMIKHGSNFV